MASEIEGFGASEGVMGAHRAADTRAWEMTLSACLRFREPALRAG